jgi:hypothetical protein
MTSSIPPVAPQPLPEPAAQATQNLFEHMAMTAQGLPQGASPAQLGEGLMQRLDGFLDRSHRFAERASAGVEQTQTFSPVAQAPQTTGAENKLPQDGQMDKVVTALSRMFDHSIETQMVVRGATQISGAANTLLRGQ